VPPARGETERVSAPRRNLLFATCALFLSFVAWGLLPPLAKLFEHDLHLSGMQTAVLIAMPVLLGSLLRIPLGTMSDRYGARRTFPLLLAAAALPALLVGFVSSYPALLVAAVLLGSSGAAFAVGAPFVAGWTRHERHGLALGLYALGGVGTAAAAFFVPPIVTAWGRPALGVLLALALVVGAVLFFHVAEDPPAAREDVSYREIFGAGPRLYRLSFLYFVAFGGIVGTSIFLPKLLADWFGLSLAEAGLRGAGFTLVALAARLVGGLLADRVGATPVLLVGFGAVAVDAALLAQLGSGSSRTIVAAVCLTLAGALGAAAGAVFKLVPREFPQRTGAAVGVIGAAGGLGGFLPPLFLAAAHERAHGYEYAFGGLVVASLVCALLVARRTFTLH
jgi:NNP family nitrate/nitrite transporter-like MFS transporter